MYFAYSPGYKYWFCLAGLVWRAKLRVSSAQFMPPFSWLVCWCKCVLFPLLFVVVVVSIGIVWRLYRHARFMSHQTWHTCQSPSSRRMGHYLSIDICFPRSTSTHSYTSLCVLRVHNSDRVRPRRMYKACRISRRNCTRIWRVDKFRIDD